MHCMGRVVPAGTTHISPATGQVAAQVAPLPTRCSKPDCFCVPAIDSGKVAGRVGSVKVSHAATVDMKPGQVAVVAVRGRITSHCGKLVTTLLGLAPSQVSLGSQVV